MERLMQYEDLSWSDERTPSWLARSMFYYIKSAGHFFCSPTYQVDRSNYNVMLVALTIRGKGLLTYNGKSYELEKGDGFLIDCNKPHYYASDTNDLWEFVWVHFSGCQSNEYENQISKNNGTFFTLKEDSLILKNILNIHNMLRVKDMQLDAYGSCRLLEILTEILSYSSDFRQENVPIYIKEAMRVIEENYADKISLESITKSAYMSKSYFIRQFKKCTGQSPYEYLMNYRLNEAKKLLKTSEAPVYEVALRSGFESVSHFVKYFKEHEKMTPLKFRKYWRS